MSASAYLKQAKKIASSAYIAPFQDKERARILLIGCLSNLGYGALSFTLNYDMAGYGLVPSLIYQVLRMGMMGFLFVPFTFWFLGRTKSPMLLMLLQISGLGLFFIDRSNGYINALAINVAFSPFVAMYNYRLAKNMTRGNRGNETALNTLLMIFGYSMGLLIGGWMLQHNLYHTAAVGSSICTIFSVFWLYYPTSGKDNFEKMKLLVGRHKPSSRITFFLGLLNPMVDGCMPIWMRVMGISPLGAGINMALRPMIGLVLTPVVGWLIQKKGLRAGQLGSVGLVIGWVLVAGASEFPWLLSLSLAILVTATNLISPMEVGRWLNRRSSASVMSREMIIASGRMPSYMIGILTCFLFPIAYPLVGLGLSGLFILGSMPLRKGHFGSNKTAASTGPMPE